MQPEVVITRGLKTSVSKSMAEQNLQFQFSFSLDSWNYMGLFRAAFKRTFTRLLTGRNNFFSLLEG